MHLSKTFDIFGSMQTGLLLNLLVRSFFLNSGVIFADFIECGNLFNFNDSLNSVSRTGTNMSILSLIILVGISESCEALEQSKFFSSFSISIA